MGSGNYLPGSGCLIEKNASSFSINDQLLNLPTLVTFHKYNQLFSPWVRNGKEQWIWTHCSLACTFNDEVQLMLWWNIVSVKQMPMGCANYFGATHHRAQDVRNHLEVISQLNKNDAVRRCQIISAKSSNIRTKKEKTINLHNIFFQAQALGFNHFGTISMANLIPIIWPWGLSWTSAHPNPKVDKISPPSFCNVMLRINVIAKRKPWANEPMAIPTSVKISTSNEKSWPGQ